MTTIINGTNNTTATLDAANALVDGRLGVTLKWDASIIQADPIALVDAMEAHCPRFTRFVRALPDAGVALVAATSRRQGSHKDQGWRWEVLAQDAAAPNVRRVALAESVRVGTYSAHQRLVVSVDVTTAAITTDRPAFPGEEAEALAALLDRYNVERTTLTARLITGRMLKDIMRNLNAISLSTSGAYYFVPVATDEHLVGLEVALAVAGVELLLVPVIAGASGGVGRAVQRTLLEEAEALDRDAIERLRKVKEQGMTPKGETLPDALKEAEDMLARARLFKLTMSMNTARIEETLASAQALVEATYQAIADRVKLGA